MEKRSHRRNVIWWHKRPSRDLTRVRSDVSDIHDGREQNAPFKGPNTDALGRSSHVTAGMSPFKLETLKECPESTESHHLCERKERDGLTVDRRPGNPSTEMAYDAKPTDL
jgi:hypothetical protein